MCSFWRGKYIHDRKRPQVFAALFAIGGTETTEVGSLTLRFHGLWVLNQLTLTFKDGVGGRP
jgi:hypothetical protein